MRRQKREKLTENLRKTKAFRELFPLRLGDYVRYKRSRLGEDSFWRYGTLENIYPSVGWFLIHRRFGGYIHIHSQRGDKIEKARRRTR